MNCPKCNQPAIGFIEWARGLEAFKTNCDSCGTDLKANSITIIGFILTLIITVASVFVVKMYFDPELSKGFLKFVFALPVAFVSGFIVFKVGGYKESN